MTFKEKLKHLMSDSQVLESHKKQILDACESEAKKGNNCLRIHIPSKFIEILRYYLSNDLNLHVEVLSGTFNNYFVEVSWE